MKTERLEAITDGVIAIAATIMVLELAVPNHDTFSGLIDQWPVFLAHFNSFFLIYIMWYGHARGVEIVDKVNPAIVLVNGIWLGTLSLIPFFTYWVGIHPFCVIPQFLYTAVFLLTSLIFQVLFFMISKEYPDLRKLDSLFIKRRLPIYILLVIGLVVCFIRPIYTLVIVFITVLYMIYLMLVSK